MDCRPTTAAIALQSSLTAHDGADPSAFIANLSGSHRFILSYLTEQVLDQQPKEIRQFLLQTAILDKLHGDLCDAVTGRSDGRLMLERLLGANLFIIALDGQGQWYRYHHLFADLLRDRQQALLAQDTAVRHRRAAHWYAQMEMAAEAIQHALAAADYGLAVTLLESHALRLITQGYVKTVNGWVQQIPQRWQSQSPRTNLALAWMHLLRGAYAQAAPFLERLRSAMDDFPLSQLSADEAALKAEWLVLQSLLFYMEGEATQSEALAKQALALAPAQDGPVRSLAYYALASVYQLRRAYDQAVESYQLAVQHGRAADNLMAEMLSTIGLAMMAFEHGRLHLAFDIAAPIDERWKQAGSLPPISAVVYGVLGEVCLQWDQLQQARYYIERSLQLSRLGGINTGVIFWPCDALPLGPD